MRGLWPKPHGMRADQELLHRAKAFAQRSGLSLSTVSRKLFNDGKKLDLIERGGSLTIATLEQVTARLAALEKSLPSEEAAA